VRIQVKLPMTDTVQLNWDDEEPMTSAMLECSGETLDLAYSQTAHRSVVLIVEDEFLIRMDAVDMIEAGGFEVVEAKDADQAIEILEHRPDITVVFTDVHMPGSMDGLKLAAAVRGRWPPIKIVATSGKADLSSEDLPFGSRFVRKPYSARDVVSTLREVTGNPL
jgi:two-component system, response regulator PdtaR